MKNDTSASLETTLLERYLSFTENSACCDIGKGMRNMKTESKATSMVYRETRKQTNKQNMSTLLCYQGQTASGGKESQSCLRQRSGIFFFSE